jgi:hypothetical protein
MKFLKDLLIINEMFSSKIELEITNSSSEFKTTAEIDEKTITFEATKSDFQFLEPALSDVKDPWEIVFYQEGKHGYPLFTDTKAGSEIKIFSMVKQSFEIFYKVKNPTCLLFTAEKTRVNLYVKFIKKFLPEWSYEIITPTVVSADSIIKVEKKSS